jgi:hypothetical protein
MREETKKIKYWDGIKYQLAAPVWLFTGIKGYDVSLSDVRLHPDGFMEVFALATWDGPSGPAIDTKNFMRGSLGHDKIYKLIRYGSLPMAYRATADKLMNKWNKEDGMWWPRRWWTLRAVRQFAKASAERKSVRQIRTAP